VKHAETLGKKHREEARRQRRLAKRSAKQRKEQNAIYQK
jgi:hypothetical protein